MGGENSIYYLYEYDIEPAELPYKCTFDSSQLCIDLTNPNFKPNTRRTCNVNLGKIQKPKKSQIVAQLRGSSRFGTSPAPYGTNVQCIICRASKAIGQVHT